MLKELVLLSKMFFMIKVLLISPTDPEKPQNLKLLVGGENTFTRTLLNNPPKNVEYTYHIDALKKGLIKYTLVHNLIALLVKLRILPLSSGSQVLRVMENFDIVHCHSYSIKLYGSKAPLIVSDSSSNYLYLKDYINWPIWRIKIGYFLRFFLFSIFRIIDCDTNWSGAQKILVFSNYARKIHRELGVPSEKMEVVYPGVSVDYKNKKKKHKELNILFVGIWFERKGGLLLLEAFRKISNKYPNVKLTVVGPVTDQYKMRALNIDQKDFVPKEKLLREFFPNADVFVLVPPKVEGFGFSVLEAMSFGIPVVVSNVCALPELVENGKTGFVVKPGSVNDLVEKLEILIKDQTLREKMGDAARKRFLEKFSIEKSNSGLLKIYNNALKSS